jgi:hypothetical protein
VNLRIFFPAFNENPGFGFMIFRGMRRAPAPIRQPDDVPPLFQNRAY